MSSGHPQIYSIAAHRGFADALVAGLVPRYSEEGLGLARLTLVLPSSRAARTVSEAFVRHYGENGSAGLLMPRMVVVGDLDLDESLGPLFDSLNAGADIPPACDPRRRWLRLAELIRDFGGEDAPRGSALLRLAFDTGQVMDRLLAEEIAPEELLADRVIDLLGDLSDHWRKNLHRFASIQRIWLAELEDRGEVDAATRRNLLFRKAARAWRDHPPATPVVAAGVTSAAPALARLLKTISELPRGAVILPDLDLSMAPEVWEELGSAGGLDAETPFARGDAVTHPQYHLKLLLNRMGINRGEVQQWHRAGLGKGPPARSHAISSLFLPPEASKAWVGLPAEQRRLSGIRLIECRNPEEEAQALALLVREALEEPGKRVAVVTPDRGLAGRVTQHLRRWNIVADDSAGRPLPQTAAGRLFLLLAEVAAQRAAPVSLMALLEHPLVRMGEGREDWLKAARDFELALRGPRPAPGLAALGEIAEGAGLQDWWAEVETILAPLCAAEDGDELLLAQMLDLLSAAGESLCGDALWSREDGRSLSRFVEQLRLHARDVGTTLEMEDMPRVLRDAMDREAVRPPYGGHPRVAIYGLLESRMTRADLVICTGLNEGVWPATPATDPILAPAVLRALGVPGAEFRIGLAAHDLAGAMGAPEVVLSRAYRDAGSPTIASRFLLRVRALLGDDLLAGYTDGQPLAWSRAIDSGADIPHHPRPSPEPLAAQRPDRISVTTLDRLRSDPYQFYASKILALEELESLDEDASARWQGILAHSILQDWHDGKGTLDELASRHLGELHAHPLVRALWRPRLMKALKWIGWRRDEDTGRKTVGVEKRGSMQVRGVTIYGTADRIDRLEDGSLAIVDYKTGEPPSTKQVENGYALQLGTLGLIAEAGGFEGISGTPKAFEYWSLGKAKDKNHRTGFGYVQTPLLMPGKRSGIEPEEFLPKVRGQVEGAVEDWILGDKGFTARLNPDASVYNTYDQLMRLDEWIGAGEDES